MKRISPFYLYLLAFLPFLSCNSGEDSLIRSIDTLMEAHPDSALTIVTKYSVKDFHTEIARAEFALLKSRVLYKSYIDVSNDSLTKIAVDYFSKQSDPSKKRDAWYHHGLVQLNMGRYAESIVSFEKAEREARTADDSFSTGLILRSKGNLYNKMLNYSAAIECQTKAIEAFTQAGKNAYASYSLFSLGTEYMNNKDYQRARDCFIRIKDFSSDPVLLAQCSIRLAAIMIEKHEDPFLASTFYQSCPQTYYSLMDYGYYALAQERCGKRDSSDIWINRAYQHASNAADTAAIDYMHSRIEALRGNYRDSYILVDNALRVQDSNTISILQESLAMALKEYYHNELTLEETARKAERERLIWIGIILMLIVALGWILILSMLKYKDRELADQMAKFSVTEQERLTLQKGNATLLGNLFSERLHHLDQLSHEYIITDDKGKKDLVFATFKKYLEQVRNDESLYQSLENDLDLFCGGIMSKFKTQIPAIKGEKLRILSLFFAGLPYETIQLITRRNSVDSLKMLRSRIRKEIKDANAPDTQLFLEMLEMKKANKTATGESNK